MKSEIPEINLKELENFVDRMRNDVERVKLDDFMAKEELPRVLDAKTYLAQFAHSDENQVFGLSGRQIEIIVAAIVASVPKLKIDLSQ